MPKKIDEKKTRKALRRLARAKRAADTAKSPDASLSEWESDFLGSLEDRLETFGSAFTNPEKGNTDEALSARQALKLREIENKAAGKPRKMMSRGQGFKRKSASTAPRSRDINDDIDPPAPRSEPAKPPEPERPAERPADRPATGFKPVIIEGGKARR